MSFGIWELVIILLIVALLFGTKKLKTVGGDLGGAIKGFRNAMKEADANTDTNTLGDKGQAEGMTSEEKTAAKEA